MQLKIRRVVPTRAFARRVAQLRASFGVVRHVDVGNNKHPLRKLR